MSKSTIRDVEMRPAKNGMTISYYENKPTTSNGSGYGGMDSKRETKVFSADQCDEAMDEFMKLSGLKDPDAKKEGDEAEGSSSRTY